MIKVTGIPGSRQASAPGILFFTAPLALRHVICPVTHELQFMGYRAQLWLGKDLRRTRGAPRHYLLC